MKVCILGGTGGLGHELNMTIEADEVISFGKDNFDIIDVDKSYNTLKSIRPGIIIHAAGFTDVDECETKKKIAFEVNAEGTKNIAVIAETLKSKLIYISTEYVFDGTKQDGYHEMDLPNPINIYGKSKYQGELEVQKNMEEYFIVRTSCLFGSKNKNFIKSIINLSNNNTLIKVVEDQKICPTYGKDLGEAINSLIKQEEYGLYHLVNSSYATWYELAQEILRIKKISAKILPVPSRAIQRKAIRPKNSILNNNSSIKLRPWNEALKEYLDR
ncbi:dTDP-4-dehydrorhamnose reductase [Natronincola peptidivorans]|uniref:dTDP-4-dehydrorhamnose reductase n=1 Tax=Natronincola peptidivorans TaxID=426128 RepID=A0A1H9YT74_9FIRM|nr:dTDP-4-dehydrorhamnose reductase [Natronincola peptidivorans]SES72329.1 dTDP-4-dehydrorhamnose reductase [Natronincola peptidivorans]